MSWWLCWCKEILFNQLIWKRHYRFILVNFMQLRNTVSILLSYLRQLKPGSAGHLKSSQWLIIMPAQQLLTVYSAKFSLIDSLATAAAWGIYLHNLPYRWWLGYTFPPYQNRRLWDHFVQKVELSVDRYSSISSNVWLRFPSIEAKQIILIFDTPEGFPCSGLWPRKVVYFLF